MEQAYKLTVIIPAYNESEGIADNLKELLAFSKGLNWRIVVVNDGSSDNTQGICEEFASDIDIISHSYNKGYGASLKTGIRAATTDFIAFYDADRQHNPQDLKNLYDHIGNNDMIVGERGKDSHQDWMRKPGKWVLSRVANFLTGKKIPDLNSGLRVIKRESIINLLHLFPDGFSFSTTSTIALMNMGFSVVYHPIVVNKRVGKSTVRQLHHGTQTLMLILRLIVLFNPLKVFIPVSFALLGIGTIYEIIWGIVLSDSLRLLPAAILTMLSGVMIFFFGLLVDQVSEMRKHMYDR